MALPREVIEDLVNDPDFLNLSESEQDSLTEELNQKLMGTVPGSEGILKRVSGIGKEALAIGSGLTFPLPQAARELSKSPFSGPVELPSAIMSGKEPLFDIPEPETTFGQLAPFVPLGFGAAKGGIGLGKLGVKGFNRFLRTGPIKQEIKGIDDLLSVLKSQAGEIKSKASQIGRVKGILSKRGTRESTQIAVEGIEEISKRTDELFDAARENYKAVLRNIDPKKVNIEDLVKVIDDTLIEKGAKGATLKSIQEEKLISLKSELQSMIKKPSNAVVKKTIDPITNIETEEIIQPAVKKLVPKLTRPEELKIIQNRIYGAVSGRKDLEGEFLSNFGKMLDRKGISSFTKANKVYRDTYQLADETSEITKGALKKAAQGSPHISPQEIEAIAKTEGKLGTNFIEQVKAQSLKSSQQRRRLASRKISEKRRLTGKEEETQFLTSKRKGLASELKGRQLRKGAVATLVGAPIVGKLFGIFGRRKTGESIK